VAFQGLREKFRPSTRPKAEQESAGTPAQG
jgi:hypothetical protein